MRRKPTRYDDDSETLLIELRTNPATIDLDDYDDAQYRDFIDKLMASIEEMNAEDE